MYKYFPLYSSITAPDNASNMVTVKLKLVLHSNPRGTSISGASETLPTNFIELVYVVTVYVKKKELPYSLSVIAIVKFSGLTLIAIIIVFAAMEIITIAVNIIIFILYLL